MKSILVASCMLGTAITTSAFAEQATQQPAPATQAATAPGPDKTLLQKIADAWANVIPAMNFDDVAQYYAQDPRNVFYDIAPLKYTGWREYVDGVKKVFPDYSSLKIAVNPDAQFHRRGNIVWATATFHEDAVKKDGTKEAMDGRWTAVWEKRGDHWLIVHDHASVPLAPPSATTTRK